MDTASTLTLAGSRKLTCKIQPVVLFSILDHYQRRPEGAERVIGTLVGVDRGDVIEIRDCFPVPHSESASQVKVDMEFSRTMFALHNKIAPREVIVGWYATGTDITEHSVLIHDFYNGEARSQSTIHLTVDTTLQNSEMAVNAYVGTELSLGGQHIGLQFQPVTYEVETFEADRIALEMMAKNKTSPGGLSDLESEYDSLEGSVRRLYTLLETVSEYVRDVLSGDLPEDASVGRVLWEAVACVPVIADEEFERLFSNSVQDLLMVVYLANITRTQLALAQKIDHTFSV